MAELPRISEMAYLVFQDGDDADRVVDLISPATVFRCGGDDHRTIIENLDENPVGIELIGTNRAQVIVDAGRNKEEREKGTSVVFVGGEKNHVAVWNPKRFPVTVDYGDLPEEDAMVDIYIRSNRYMDPAKTESLYRRRGLTIIGNNTDNVRIRSLAIESEDFM
jgi:hypothetical protein